MLDRLRQLFAGPASAGLVLVMLVGCLFLWVGVPLGWLWIGSQIQSSASLGTALLVTMAGITVTIVAVFVGLTRLNRWHAELQERRARPASGASALEVILVSSAGIALVGFGIWFFLFAGASPVPLNIGF
jgi:uncharacterized membrane protein YbhN (UPF0104 family)